MQRVAIIGSCPKVYRFAYGAGKSTLSKALGEKLKLPIIHLDAYYWQSGWQEVDETKLTPALLEAQLILTLESIPNLSIIQ